jgi:uncharacterized membrane protein
MWRGFTQRKALAKTISWRGLSFVCTTFGVWVVTGRPSLAASVGVLEVAVKSIGYYLHECLWESVARHGVSNPPFVACFRAKDAWLTRESCTIQPEELVL